MIKNLLVPLDGSRLAEAALPAAVQLAQKLRGSLTLIHIIERNAPREVHGERHLTQTDEAIAYLDEVAGRSIPEELPVEQHVHQQEVDDISQSIANYAMELSPDLIVMCTHGWGGLRDLMIGSVAQQVVARVSLPVLLIRPSETGSPQLLTCRRILVALDGTPEHENALQVAAELARACDTAIHLTVTIPTPGTLPGEQAATGLLLPATMRAVLELAEQGAAAYLQRQAAGLEAQGIKISAEISRGDPGTAIVDTARRADADLIAMGTHGKAGLEAFWAGSVAPRVSSNSHLPVLLVPII